VSVAARGTDRECGINLKTFEGFPIHLKRSRSASYLYYDALVDLFYVLSPLAAWQTHAVTGDPIDERRRTARRKSRLVKDLERMQLKRAKETGNYLRLTRLTASESPRCPEAA
jgi:hypothetical protein